MPKPRQNVYPRAQGGRFGAGVVFLWLLCVSNQSTSANVPDYGFKPLRGSDVTEVRGPRSGPVCGWWVFRFKLVVRLHVGGRIRVLALGLVVRGRANGLKHIPGLRPHT